MRRPQCAFPVLIVLAFAALCSGQQKKEIKSQTTETQPAKSKTVAKRLVSTWKLVAYEAQRPNGEMLYPFGQAPVGMLTYDANGHMTVQIMRPDRAKVDREKATLEDMQAAYKGYVAYFGTYDVSASGDTVVHHVQGSLDTWRLGVDMVRPLELRGDRLILTAEFKVDGEVRKHKVTWERLK